MFLKHLMSERCPPTIVDSLPRPRLVCIRTTAAAALEIIVRRCSCECSCVSKTAVSQAAAIATTNAFEVPSNRLGPTINQLNCKRRRNCKHCTWLRHRYPRKFLQALRASPLDQDDLAGVLKIEAFFTTRFPDLGNISKQSFIFCCGMNWDNIHGKLNFQWLQFVVLLNQFEKARCPALMLKEISLGTQRINLFIVMKLYHINRRLL